MSLLVDRAPSRAVDNFIMRGSMLRRFDRSPYFLPKRSPSCARAQRAAAIVAAVAGAMTGSALAAETSKLPSQPSMSATGTKYKADADMQAVLDALASLHGKPIETLDAAEARKQPTPADAVKVVLQQKGKDTSPTALVPGITSKDTTIQAATGSLPLRIYTPAGNGPFPVVVYYHGGGWVIADKETYDGGARGLSKQANAVVVSVDYRRAPEAKFPAQHDDAFAAYKWAAANAASLNGDAAKIALAGESAGGNLAIATAVAARDAGGPQPVHVLSVYPIAQVSDFDTPSYRDSEKAKPLNKAMMQWFVDKTIAKPDDKKDWRLDLVHADLKGLPPVTLINAQIDPLRSDGDMLADALRKAGVKVDHKIYAGATHEFFGMAAVVKDARDAQALAGQRLRQSFEVDKVSAAGRAATTAKR
jgi:acetyl esterase/lipase